MKTRWPYRFPPKLRAMCHCLNEVVTQRLQHAATPDAIFVVIGTVIFLRFINPVLVSPAQHAICDAEPPFRVKRALTLVGKLLQCVASHVLHPKEQYMKPFNDFLRTNIDCAKRYSNSSTEVLVPHVQPHSYEIPLIIEDHVFARGFLAPLMRIPLILSRTH